MPKTILAVDFDGVLHSYASGWKGPDVILDPPFPGAIEWLHLMTQHFRVEIFSSRSGMQGGIPAMVAWINQWAVKVTGDANWTSEIIYPTVKPPAKVTLDDRALTFTGQWPTVQEIKDFQPWYLKNK